MSQPATRLCIALAVLSPLTALPGRGVAQDRFEIEVYPYETAARGEWELETHLNYTQVGTTAFDGRVAPTEGQTRLAAELTHGLTDHWELSAYLLAAHRSASGVDFAGWRMRSRFRAPETWRLPVQLGLSLELEATQPAFSDSPLTLELVPIFQRRVGRWQFTVDPAFERDLSGPEASEGWEFEPRARAAVTASRTVTLALEYYGALGHLGAILPAESQVHQFFPSVELRLGDELSVDLGVGVGATAGSSAARLIVDPIDATRNFVRGIPVFATLLAIEDGDEVVAGVVSAPALRTRWHAARGAGAFREGARLAVSGVRALERALLFHGNLGPAEGAPPRGIFELIRGVERTRGLGDFYQHMLVAEAAGEIAIDPVMQPWDIAAVQVVVEEAGGRATTLSGERSIYGGSLVTSNGPLHQAILDTLTSTESP